MFLATREDPVDRGARLIHIFRLGLDVDFFIQDVEPELILCSGILQGTP